MPLVDVVRFVTGLVRDTGLNYVVIGGRAPFCGEGDMTRKAESLLAGPKRQWNLRMRVSLLDELGKLASALGMRVSQVALALLNEASSTGAAGAGWAWPPEERRLSQEVLFGGPD